MRIIAPGKRNKVIIRIVQKLIGILIFINEPRILITKIITRAINNDLKSHLKKFFISFTHLIYMGQSLFLFFLF